VRTTRAQRRNALAKAKRRAAAKLRRWGFDTTPVAVGSAAAQHNTCACWACTHKRDESPRRMFTDLMKLEEVR